MKKKEHENSLLGEEYAARVNWRIEQDSDAEKRTSHAWFIARSGEDHFARLTLAIKRFVRARGFADQTALAYERDVIACLLYEIADTAYLTLSVLDFDKLDLSASEDGLGFVGEVAHEVVRTLSLLDNQANRLLEIEKSSAIRVDFTTPVDEKEGITYLRKHHWQDMVPGSVSDSFRGYFRHARDVVRTRLDKKPDFWVAQTIRQYLVWKHYDALLQILQRLEADTLKSEGEA